MARMEIYTVLALPRYRYWSTRMSRLASITLPAAFPALTGIALETRCTPLEITVK